MADYPNRDELMQEGLKEQAERLAEAGEHYRNIPLPDSIDLYIERGIQEAKRRARRRRGWRYGGITAAALLLVFVLGLRVSPTLAAAVSAIPGLEYFVNLFRFDKSLELALENDYVQPVGEFDEHDGVRFTINGVIADAHRMEIMYSLHSLEGAGLQVTGAKVIDADTGEPMRSVSLYHGTEGTISVHLMEDETLPQRVIVEMGVSVYPLASPDGPPLEPINAEELPEPWKETYPVPDGIWAVEFDVDHERFLGMQQVYDIHETIEFQGQRITFKRAVVHPIGVSLQVEIDPNNTMEIFGLEFDGLKLINEKGESYGSYMRMNDHYYFESPYFAMPEELYLVGDRIRALDKDLMEVEVDLDQRRIVRAPDEDLVLEEFIERDDSYVLVFRVHQEANDNAMYNVLQYQFRDEAGHLYERLDHSYATKDSNDSYTRNYVVIPKLPYEGNLIFPIIMYPNFIEAPFRIQIK